MNYGLPTKVVDDVVIEEGENLLDIEWESSGYTVAGGLSLSSGGYPGSADISGVICMNTADQSLTFGLLTQEADGAYSAYEVPGLAAGVTYQLVFFYESDNEGTPDIFTTGEPFAVSADNLENDAVINRNGVPVLMAQAVQNPNDAGKVNIGIFSTAYLTDADISVAADEPTVDSTAGEIYVAAGGGSLSDVTLSGDRRTIRASYTKGADDSDVSIFLAVHYGNDATTLVKAISFNVNTLAMNSDAISTYLAGQVKLGNGDATQIYLPAGSLDTSDDGKAIVSIEKTSDEPGELAGASSMAIRKEGRFAKAMATPLPEGATAAGSQYDFSYSAANTGATVSQIGTITVQLQYDPQRVGNVDNLQVMHLTGGNWVQEETNRTVDTENHTISVDVASLSPFVPAEVEAAAVDGDPAGGGTDGGTVSSSGGNSSSGCFIGTARTGVSGSAAALWLLLLPAAVLWMSVKKTVSLKNNN